MRENCLADDKEFSKVQVVLGVVHAPRTNDEFNRSQAISYMIHGRQISKTLLVRTTSLLRFGVIKLADQFPLQRLAGVMIETTAPHDSLMNGPLVRFDGRCVV